MVSWIVADRACCRAVLLPLMVAAEHTSRIDVGTSIAVAFALDRVGDPAG